MFALTVLCGLLLSLTSRAGTRYLWVPQPGVSTYAIGAFSFSTNLAGGCNPIATTATITTSPVHGTVTVSAQNFTPAQCGGASLPGVATFYTWTDTTGSPGSGTDAFHVHFASSQGVIDVDVFVSEGFPGTDEGQCPPPPPPYCEGCDGPTPAPSTPPISSDDPVVTAAEPSANGCAGIGGAIDIGSGNVFYEHTDYATAGANPLAFTRYYNSGGDIASPAASFTGTAAVNRNWRSTYDRYIRMLNPSVVAVERPDGRVLDFFLVGSTWTPDTNVDYTLTNSGLTWTLTGPDDTVETYTTNVVATLVTNVAILNSIKTRNGYTQTLSYTGPELTSVTDSYNRTLAFAYNGDGTLASVTTPDNTTISYSYASATGGQQLTTATFPTSPPQTITYVYGDSSLPFALTGVTDEDGNPYRAWTYDSDGRGLTSLEGGSLNANLVTMTYPTVGTTTTVTNALGVTDTYTFVRPTDVGGAPVGAPRVTQVSRAATSMTSSATRTFTYEGSSQRML